MVVNVGGCGCGGMGVWRRGGATRFNFIAEEKSAPTFITILKAATRDIWRNKLEAWPLKRN